MADRKSLLPGRDEPVFPITDRSTPVLDRINERRNGKGTIAQKAGERVAQLSITDNKEEREEVMEQFREDFRTSLSDELGVPESAIRDEVVNEFAVMFGGLRETDLIDEAMLDLITSDEETEAEEDEDTEEEDESDSEGPNF